ncbi:PREDICTED: glyoxalase domain-containing protein 4-like [Amphimedon queenslandica]|uniref:VOC domain-containing protein n=1 Tax=Amphimedon queenslandica TaxID=400682 RepID=A0A1X7V0Z7_AMPQE|nr:PREDICTED: glyoxalase domain-containing protein 4-like [Amphimedon queenslandica]|eukprot:XP_003386086.1 PREDICTED: glyoxalase domain-containing protein 4-like [Amphimedon queenslandica]
MASGRRALHYVFKIADRDATVKFYRDILGMKVLRHEEFNEGCKAACNGPYDGLWSKSMVGYGEEDSHFVAELTYNYGIKSYKKGNDFKCISIHSRNAFSKLQQSGMKYSKESDDSLKVDGPGGYTFILYDKNSSTRDPVQSVCLSVTDLERSKSYWADLLGMTIFAQNENFLTLGYAPEQAKLVLERISEPMDHAEAYGRIAFSCPRAQLPDIEKAVSDKGWKILTPLVSLDTPGKATVEVVILADPDGHEICFVGDEAFRELPKVDPKADQLMDEAIAGDKSVAWFAEKELKKAKKLEQEN